MKQTLVKMILFSMFLIPSFFCASVPVDVKTEVFSRTDSSGAYCGEWYILSNDIPFKIVDKVSFGQPGSDNKKLTEIGNENSGYIQSGWWGNLSDSGNRWKFLKPEKVNGEIIVYLKRSNNSTVIKYNVNGTHKNKLYNEHQKVIKICEINGKQYSYSQNKAKIDKLQIAYDESLPENIAKRAEIKRLEKAKLAEHEEKVINEKRAVDEEQKRFETWKTDSNTILSIISGLRNIEKVSSTDSDLQRKDKTEWRNYLHDEELNRIKKLYYNKKFTLQAAMVQDVVPETRLNKQGQKKKRELENALKSENPVGSYLAVQYDKNRYKYEVETGAYEIRFSIPVPDAEGYSKFRLGIRKVGLTNSKSNDTENRFNVNIILIVKSKIKALKYSKEDVITLTGRIAEIKHGFTFMDEYVNIKLVE